MDNLSRTEVVFVIHSDVNSQVGANVTRAGWMFEMTRNAIDKFSLRFKITPPSARDATETHKMINVTKIPSGITL